MSDARIVFVVGRKGAGKSTLLRTWAAQHPRTVWLDPMLEEVQRIGSQHACYDLAGLRLQLRAKASRRRWALVFAGEPRDYPAAVALLQPAHPTVTGYAQAIGGVTLVCGEADLLLPNNGLVPPAVRGLIHRGRHNRLSLLAAARRPTEVARDLSAMADLVAVFATHEPRDVAWLRALGGEQLVQQVAQLARFQYALYRPG